MGGVDIMSARSPNVRLTIEMLESRALPSTVADLPIVPDIDYSMSQNLQSIYQRGQAMGNHANVFMKVGDSLTAEPDSISAMSPTRFDIVSSGLATGYPELVDTWQTYASPKVGGDSFGRNSFAARSRTYVSQALMNLPAEIATIRPSIALIHVGTNDFAYGPESFRQQLLAIVSHTIDSGVIPIVTLLPTAFNFEKGGSYNGFVDQFNSVVIQVAEQFNIPVWNLHKALEPLPLYGLRDGIHLTAIGGGALFTAGALNFGYNMRNLSALQVLDKVRDVIANPIVPTQSDAPWQSLQAGRQYTATTTDDPFRVVVKDRDNNTILSFNSFYNG